LISTSVSWAHFGTIQTTVAIQGRARWQTTTTTTLWVCVGLDFTLHVTWAATWQTRMEEKKNPLWQLINFQFHLGVPNIFKLHIFSKHNLFQNQGHTSMNSIFQGPQYDDKVSCVTMSKIVENLSKLQCVPTVPVTENPPGYRASWGIGPWILWFYAYAEHEHMQD
jgi:hypothetical protein